MREEARISRKGLVSYILPSLETVNVPVWAPVPHHYQESLEKMPIKSVGIKSHFLKPVFSFALVLGRTLYLLFPITHNTLHTSVPEMVKSYLGISTVQF